jgi:hypothetical protein
MPATRNAVDMAPIPVDRHRGGSASPTYANATAAKLAASKPCTMRSTPTTGSDDAAARPAVAIASAAIPGTRITLRPYRSDSGPKIKNPIP